MALLDSLAAHWRLDEASGTRVDATGRGNDLSATGSPGSRTGKIGDALDLNGSSQYVARADNADLSMADADFTFAAWAYSDSAPSAGQYPVVVAKDLPGTVREYQLHWNGDSNRFRFVIGNGGVGTVAGLNATSFGAPSSGVWYFIVVWHDAAANTANIQVNNGVADSTATTGAGPDTTVEFRLGARSDGLYFWDGAIDSVSIWDRVLTADERTALYNGGAGLDYPFAGKGLPVLAHHWADVFGGGW